jgi:uncharacterized membrane protein
MKRWRKQEGLTSTGFVIEATFVALMVAFGYLVLAWTVIERMLKFASWI